jgi:hypothetical protein
MSREERFVASDAGRVSTSSCPAFSAQALATAEFGFSVPGNVAQPPFSMSDRRSQDKALLNATSFAAASVWRWNFSTQIGASTATTAVSARWVAIRSAVLPSVHPSDENPTTVNATAPATAPHIAGFTPGWIFISSPWLREKRISPVSPEESYRAASRQVLDSETTQRTPGAARLSGIDDRRYGPERRCDAGSSRRD